MESCDTEARGVWPSRRCVHEGADHQSGELGTFKTVTAIKWPGLSGIFLSLRLKLLFFFFFIALEPRAE